MTAAKARRPLNFTARLTAIENNSDCLFRVEFCQFEILPDNGCCRQCEIDPACRNSLTHVHASQTVGRYGFLEVDDEAAKIGAMGKMYFGANRTPTFSWASIERNV
jgi:hypothetical protein